MDTQTDKKLRVLLELRPGFEGYAGIPQETRLLFRGLRMLESVEAAGMLQTSHRVLAKGTVEYGLFSAKRTTQSRRINRYSRVVVSAAERPFSTVWERMFNQVEKRYLAIRLTIGNLFGRSAVKLSDLNPHHFEDFIWRTLFAKTLPASDYDLITGAQQKICSVPWHVMHMVGLNTMSVLQSARYVRLDTRGVDIFISQTPYPAIVSRKTALVVRYHDALPVLMPHTIPDKSLHQATHFHSLTGNVKHGAWFACVSESTRRDLLSLFPQAASRAVTIHNMVSHHYFREDSSADLVPGIVRARLHEGDAGKGVVVQPKFFTIREQENFYARSLGKRPLKYLIVVSTIEPRKNHARVLAAWEVIKSQVDPDMKLVVVGGLGWDYSVTLQGFRSWIDRGELFMLSGVPAPDLRVLYRHAAATICPSVGEGFDFAGVESMRSGGVVLASDIAVHREIYDGAADYFNPYSTASLVESLERTLYAPDAPQVQARLRALGDEVASRYLPDRILPKWSEFLARVAREHAAERSFFGMRADSAASIDA